MIVIGLMFVLWISGGLGGKVFSSTPKTNLERNIGSCQIWCRTMIIRPELAWVLGSAYHSISRRFHMRLRIFEVDCGIRWLKLEAFPMSAFSPKLHFTTLGRCKLLRFLVPSLHSAIALFGRMHNHSRTGLWWELGKSNTWQHVPQFCLHAHVKVSEALISVWKCPAHQFHK